ncbi:MAG TPA: DUF3160 domain-containing protein, partial [Polyangiaceae bacterium]|nr:DUF3160 domain-containing protein [Polyangiaceae bacterium]
MKPGASEHGASDQSAPRPELVHAPPGVPLDIASTYQRLLERHRDLSLSDLPRELGDVQRGEPDLGFDPTQAKYYGAVRRELQLTNEEQRTFKRLGFVVADHGQPTSMGAAYYNIFTRDLPVLVTTDSILHAVHVSYDSILESVEQRLLQRII